MAFNWPEGGDIRTLDEGPVRVGVGSASHVIQWPNGRLLALFLPLHRGLDLRQLPLVQWKIRKALMPDLTSRLLYADHVEHHGEGFFRACCEWGLEEMVARPKKGGESDWRARVDGVTLHASWHRMGLWSY